MHKTNCLDPCEYMEYKVGLPLPQIFSVILSYLQLASDPFISHVENESSVKILFGNGQTLVEQEVYSFEIGDLVADCGGILGLFVGFNFLMVWDFLVSAVQKIHSWK